MSAALRRQRTDRRPRATTGRPRQVKRLVLYSPHPTQLAFHNCPARYRVAAWGRQSGKSTGALNELLKRAWENPGHTYWFVSPTFDQAKKQYRRLVSMLWNCRGVMLKKNQTELRVKLVNMAQIEFKSGEVFDNLLGDTLNGVVIDECRDQPKALWTRIIQPMLRVNKGWAIFISTPNGFDWFYDMAEKAKADKSGRWSYMCAPSTANPLFTKAELDEAREEMSEDEFQQEHMAEFREMGTGKVYLSHGSHNQVRQNPFAVRGLKWSPYLPIVVGLDFNVGLMCWILGQFKGDTVYYGEEIAVENTNTEECAPLLVEKVRGHKPGVILIGDASGKARRSSSSASDYAIIVKALQEAKIPVRNLTPESNPAIKDRVNIANASLKSATGLTRFYYNDEACPHLKKDLQRVKWKRGAQDAIFDKSDAKLTHMTDAAFYPVCYYSSQWRPKPGKMRVVVRS